MKFVGVLLMGAVMPSIAVNASPSDAADREMGSWGGVYHAQVVPGGHHAASITRPDGSCEALLLDPRLYRASRSMQDRPVLVKGDRMPYPAFDDDVVAIEIGDRWLVSGHCAKAGTIIRARAIARATRHRLR